MAKKNKETKVEEPIVAETVVMEQPVVKAPKVEAKPKKDKWEIKDRVYHLKGKTPVSFLMKGSDIYYFDKEFGYERELKYTKNQTTCFVDEMKGDQRLEHIVFRNGTLSVPKNKVVLQKFLSIYHPMKGILYEEHRPAVKAASQVEIIELEIEALNAAINMDIDMAEAVMRVEIGSAVSKMSSKELKRDLLLYAKKNPKLFLDLANDENILLRNFGIRAAELGIIKISSDQRTFNWGSNNRKLMTVPFDEHPYSALAQWFKTDEGMDIYSNIEKQLG